MYARQACPRRRHGRRIACGGLLALLWLLPLFPGSAVAGGGPENLLLVVNSGSADSMTVANHYIRLRRIPAQNVLYLPAAGDAEKIGAGVTDVDTFRRQILLPVLRGVQSGAATRRIDYVVYSAGFPWQINLKADVDRFLKAQAEADPQKDGPSKTGQASGDEKAGAGAEADEQSPQALREWPKQLYALGSLNGLTYLWQRVLTGDPRAYMGLNVNQYMRRMIPEQENARSMGFQSGYRFGEHGELVQGPGSSYMLSTVLGVTEGRGNTVEEILHYLQRNAAADGTHPNGTIYFMKNRNVRSTTREPAFAAAVEQLQALGVAAEILDGVLPPAKDDVQGAMIGTADFDWTTSGSTILPGAICEHLTSNGGVMYVRASQTTFAEFMRHGAAGASGTVAEPYAIQAKFPLALIHVHYARGCTLAEAFYQSVYGPYQLMIVGDPLCRPWANIPEVRVEGVESGTTVNGTLAISPTATVPGGSAVDQFELYVDGQGVARCAPGETLNWNTALSADGYHELRVVAIESSPIHSQGRLILPVTTANHGRTIEVSVQPEGPVATGTPLSIAARAPGSFGIAVMQNTRLVGKIVGEAGQLEIDPATLGAGPVRLAVIGMGSGAAADNVAAAPVDVTVSSGPSEEQGR
jgi:hypothetical protein